MQAGALVAGRYRLEGPLGEGATASVWRARDLDLGVVVALKVLRPEGVDDELARRFEREATILRSLQHPNVVRVLGAGRDGDLRFIVMDLLEGRSLAEVVAKGPLSPRDAAAVVADVAAGLDRCHREGVLHRDVKPANVVLTGDGVPVLVDFGIARADDVSVVTRADVVLGTAAYLSPEQAEARPLDARSDVYALGCVLHELVAGDPPFTGTTSVAVVVKHLQEPPPPLRGLVPDVPADLEEVVLRCLAKDPDARYGSARELEADLRQVATGEPLVHGAAGRWAGAAAATTVAAAPPPGPTGTAVLAPAIATAPQRSRRGPVAVAVVAIVAALVLGAIALAAMRSDGPGPVVVGDVVGQPAEQAEAHLVALGLTTTRVDAAGDATAGTVTATEPAAGAEVPAGSTVRLHVSLGPPPTPPPPPPDDDDDDDEKEEKEEKREEGRGGRGGR
ncbi:MAG TPA: serine/threonine protein kinase [Acidimicrobiales bacterium]|nr:serine/threonine protein kinase [Acidimicrobiales bacterium]